MNTITLKKEKIHSGTLILVNEHYPLFKMNLNGLMPVDSRFPDILMKRDSANVLQLILEKVSSGSSIVPVSGYRSVEEQTEIYENSLLENGKEFTRKFVALPNHSEHQTGLAIDLALKKENIDFICPDFPYNDICNKFRKTAPNYGYIERYPAGKEGITGIGHEPWHFRYVGFPHSKIISENGLTLEEYTDFIKRYRDDCRLVYEPENKNKIEIFYVPALGLETSVNLPKDAVYQISGNNVDGFVVTIWRKTDG